MASTVEDIAFQLERQLAEATAKVRRRRGDVGRTTSPHARRPTTRTAAAAGASQCNQPAGSPFEWLTSLPPIAHARATASRDHLLQIDEFIQQQNQQLQKAVIDHEQTIRELEGAGRRRASRRTAPSRGVEAPCAHPTRPRVDPTALARLLPPASLQPRSRGSPARSSQLCTGQGTRTKVRAAMRRGLDDDTPRHTRGRGGVPHQAGPCAHARRPQGC